jgi:hypothetical protein
MLLFIARHASVGHIAQVQLEVVLSVSQDLWLLTRGRPAALLVLLVLTHRQQPTARCVPRVSTRGQWAKVIAVNVMLVGTLFQPNLPRVRTAMLVSIQTLLLLCAATVIAENTVGAPPLNVFTAT